MKKLVLLLASLSTAFAVFAQSARNMVLIEEFTQASCGPCASANPAFNTLLDANPTKVVSIKYQTNWPGTDPMNGQTQSRVLPRKNYYNVTGVPYTRIDGQAPKPPTGTAPQDVTQQKIDLAYSMPANFDISMYHYYSANNDSIFIYCDITCTKATTGTLIAHIGLTEEEIVFASAPGTNGETVFHDVMRDMYPSGAGTTLPGAMGTVGQKHLIVVAKPLPAYIYDKTQLRVVAFIQENATKMVHQAAYNSAPAMPDAAVTAVQEPNGAVCGNPTIDIPFTIKNTGTAPLSSLQVRYILDNGPIVTLASTGVAPATPLANGISKSLMISGLSVSPGSHTIKIFTSSPNGSSDALSANDTLIKTFVATPMSIGAPFQHDFSAKTVIDPSLFIINNPAATAVTWRYSPKGNFNAGSANIPFFELAQGSVEELYLPPYDMNGVMPPLYLTFDLAHAPYKYPNNLLSDDTLSLMATNDCGTTWTKLWEKTGNTGLGTTAPTAAQYSPTSFNQWRNESVDLSSYAENGKVTLKFVGRSAYGNDVFLDNLNVAASATANDGLSTASDMSVAPNPFTGMALVQFPLAENADVRLTMYNMLGEIVLAQQVGVMAAGAQSIPLNASALAAGLYTLRLSVGEKTMTRKVSVLR